MKRAIALPLAMFISATGLSAVSARAADEPRHTFECDTPAGHFAYWERTVSGAEIEVSGKVTVNDLLTDKKWSPTIFVSLKAGSTKKGPFGLRVFAVMKTPEYLFLELLKVGGRDPIGLGMIPRTKEPVPFALRLDASGLLTVTVAGVDASTPLGDFKPEMLQLSCSTGDFEFTDVTVKEKSP